MAALPSHFIEDLKSHADIVQVVQERVPLRRSGATWKGLCPFHGEKTPSFHVNGDKGFFHCFGCGVGGDVIKFVELHDKVTFPGSGPAAGRARRPAGAGAGGREAGRREPARPGSAAEGARGRGRVVPRAAGDAGGRRRAPAARRPRPDAGDDRAARASATRRHRARRCKTRLLKEGFAPAVARRERPGRRARRRHARRPVPQPADDPDRRDNGAIIAFGGRAMEAGQQPEVPELARDGDLCQRADALRAAPEQGGDRQGQARGDGRRLFRLGAGAPGAASPTSSPRRARR